MMQHRKDDFTGAKIIISEEAYRRSDVAMQRNAIRISNLSMASRSVTERISRDEGMKPNWYCLRVMTGNEFAVEKHLDQEDVESLVVRSNPYKIVRRGRIRIVPERPVIRGYVMVRCLQIPQVIHGLLSVKGVIDIVGGPLGPYCADAKSIMHFKRMAAEGKYDHRDKPLHSFMVKEEVRVCEGPFASFNGIVLSIDGDRFRVKVEVNIFGRSTPVELDIAQIEKL